MKRQLYLAIVAILLSVIIIGSYAFLANNIPKHDSSQNIVNIIFKYGVGAKNELNTFNGTYTRDLVIDNAVTTRMILSTEELGQVKQRVNDIGFFAYPETFPAKSNSIVTPQTNYYIKVQIGSAIKEVSWNTNSQIESNIQENLNQLTAYITGMIEQKPEYKALPTPDGVYL